MWSVAGAFYSHKNERSLTRSEHNDWGTRLLHRSWQIKANCVCNKKQGTNTPVQHTKKASSELLLREISQNSIFVNEREMPSHMLLGDF